MTSSVFVYKIYDTRNSQYVAGVFESENEAMEYWCSGGMLPVPKFRAEKQTRYVLHNFSLFREINE